MKTLPLLTRRAILPALILVPVAFPAIMRAGRRGEMMSRRAAAAGGGACTTARDSRTGTTSGTTGLGGSLAIGTRFTAGATATICKAVLRLGTVGASYTIKVGIFTNNGSNLPGTLIGSYSDTLNANTVGASEGDITFINMSASITSGTDYHLVALCGSSFNSPNTTWAAMSLSLTNGVSSSSDGTTFSNVDNFSVQKFQLYS